MNIMLHAVAESQTCESGWEQYGGSCYYVGTTNQGAALFSWHAARDWCMQRGADLATITSKEEADYVTNYVREIITTQDTWMMLLDTYRNSLLSESRVFGHLLTPYLQTTRQFFMILFFRFFWNSCLYVF